jgi:hypothetical protein
MKYRITMKDPDCQVENMESGDSGFMPDIVQGKHDHHFNKWFEFGEYVELELDTEEGTIRVIPA